MDLGGKKIALVLSGGGAKGAYQTGMLRALEEAGMEREKTFLSGTSIGAMAAISYALHGVPGVRDLLESLGAAISAAKKEMTGEAAGGPADPKALLPLFERLLPDDLLAANKIPVTVCCYSHRLERPVNFRLNGLPPQDQRALVIASGSLPGVMAPTPCRGDLLSDGGVVPEGLSHPAPHNKVPLNAAAESDADLVIVSFLNLYDHVDYSILPPWTAYLESRPSVPLEKRPGSGTLDFSEEKQKRHEEMGYRETKELLAGK